MINPSDPFTGFADEQWDDEVKTARACKKCGFSYEAYSSLRLSILRREAKRRGFADSAQLYIAEGRVSDVRYIWETP